MSEALDTIHDERANGRLLPCLDDFLHEVEGRLLNLEAAAEAAPAPAAGNTANGGE